MANPYMRDALIEDMEQNQTIRPPSRNDLTGGPGAYGDTGGATTPPPTNPWDSPDSSKYAPRIVSEGGKNYLTEHGNRRELQENEVADATKYRDDFWAANPTGFQAGVGPQRNEDYAPSTDPASTTRPGSSGSTAGRFSGFNFDRTQDPTTSAKDAFAAAASKAGGMPTTKDEAEAWFNQYIKEALIAAGYQVDWVEGDKAFVRTRENPQGEEIDFLQNAGGADPMLAWQSNMAGQTTGGGDAGAGAGGATGGGPAADILGNESVMSDINAQIDKLLKSGMSLEDLIAMLSGGDRQML